MSRTIVIRLLLLATALLSSCTAAQPLTLEAAPWQDGEVSVYDVLNAGGASVGAASWTWHSDPEGWALSYDVTLDTGEQGAEVIVGPDLFPVRSRLTRSGAHHETIYSADSITIITTADDGPHTVDLLPRPTHPIDNSQSLQTQRALPLAAGYRTTYANVIPSTHQVVRTQVRVVGAETLTVAAGTFETWHVEMVSGQSRRAAWYAQEAPHLLIQYQHRDTGSKMQLRHWQPSAGELQRPTPQEGDHIVPATAIDPKPQWTLVAVAVLIQYPLMLLFPLLLGWQLRRRLGIGWSLFCAGALTFIASQVVHLPLNWALGLIGGGRGVALWPLPWMALVAGLSAGLCETLARWIALRFWLRRTRSWAEALQLGAGHGGIEAIIFGLLAGVSMVSVLTMTLAGQSLPEVVLYWQTPWYAFILAGLERVFVIAFHISMSALVMRAVMRRQIGYAAAAFGVHTAMDFWAVWAMPTFGMVWTEVGLGIIALGCLVLILRLKPESSGTTAAAAVSRNNNRAVPSDPDTAI